MSTLVATIELATEDVARDPQSPNATASVFQTIQAIDEFLASPEMVAIRRIGSEKLPDLSTIISEEAQHLVEGLHDMLSVAQQVEQMGGQTGWGAALADAIERLRAAFARVGVAVDPSAGPKPVVIRGPESSVFNPSFTVIPVRRQSEGMKLLLIRYLAVQSLGLENAVQLPRFIPVRIWLSSAHSASLTEALDDLLKTVGFSGREVFTSEAGSWFGRWFARSREALTRDEVADRIKKLERALELGVLHNPQAIVDEKQATAVARILTSLQSISEAAVQVGSLLVVKITNENGARILVRNLTQRELIAIEHDEHLLTDPRRVLENLGGFTDAARLSAGAPQQRP